ncbi:hypothetical protein [Proteus genomosp. 6]|uniref:hypothetical protein n=1 Tax=Proteus genomosp. 6 TaxID=1311820 RepID=UPI0032DA0EDF
MVWQQRLNLPTNIPFHVVAVWQMVAEGQSDRMVSDMEVCMKQSCVTEFLHVEKMAPIDIHWRPNSGCEHSKAVGVAFQQW